MPHTIVTPVELRERLDDPRLVIVDCRHSLADFGLGLRLYEQSHLPGAFFASVESDLAGHKTGTNGRHPLPDPEAFANVLRAMGVERSTRVVAYDAGGDMFAARLWFLCHWIGHADAVVLDGGFSAWTARGYPTTSQRPPVPKPGILHVELHPELVVDAAYVLGHLADPEVQLLDARTPERYRGETEPMDPVAGHIPGARNRSFKENFNADGTLKSPERLRAELEGANLDPRRVVHQCGSGVSAAAGLWAMTHAGLDGSRLYGGSWSEWVADRSRPVATGSEPG